ncbi:MAG TPA: luciferase family protein, partial [Actinomycetota bacterium]|nr:luciferase family protein [Actinomycetota bacterium]
MGAGERIRAEVGSWPGVSVEPHRFGGWEYKVGRREMGHVHGDRLADLP